MSDLNVIPDIDYHDVVTLSVPANISRKFSRRKTFMRIKIYSIAVLIILVIVIPITVIFTKNTKTQIDVTNTIVTIPTTTTTKLLLFPGNINTNIKWIQTGNTVAGDDKHGTALNQLFYPENIYADDDETIYIADTDNHRIVKWENGAKNGQIVAGGNERGNRSDQLNGPTDVILDKETNSLIICDSGNKRVMQWFLENTTNGLVIISDLLCYGLGMDNEGYLYVSDYQRHEITRWQVGNTSGIVIAGGNGKGNQSDQLDSPRNIFIDQNHDVYVSEEENCRVTKWIKNSTKGIVVAGGHGKGNNLTQLSSPRGLIVDSFNTVYIADSFNNRIMRWPKGARQGDVILGGNGKGKESNRLYEPIGLSFDQQGNLYVSDREKHQVQRFDINLNVTA